MNNSENKVYYMELDGVVKTPEKYDKMDYAGITAECDRLSKEKANKMTVTSYETGEVLAECSCPLQ